MLVRTLRAELHGSRVIRISGVATMTTITSGIGQWSLRSAPLAHWCFFWCCFALKNEYPVAGTERRKPCSYLGMTLQRHRQKTKWSRSGGFAPQQVTFLLFWRPYLNQAVVNHANATSDSFTLFLSNLILLRNIDDGWTSGRTDWNSGKDAPQCVQLCLLGPAFWS